MPDSTNADRQRRWRDRQAGRLLPVQRLTCSCCGAAHTGKHESLCRLCWRKTSNGREWQRLRMAAYRKNLKTSLFLHFISAYSFSFFFITSLFSIPAKSQTYIHKGLYPGGIECTTITGLQGKNSLSTTSCTTEQQRLNNANTIKQQQKTLYKNYLINSKAMNVPPLCGKYGYKKALAERSSLPISSRYIFRKKDDQTALPLFVTAMPGDSISKIASDNGITLMDLIRLNPGIEFDAFQPGVEIRLSANNSINPKPFPARIKHFDSLCQHQIGNQNQLPSDYQQLLEQE